MVSQAVGMRCWAADCPSRVMSKWDSRVCWIHAIRYVIKGEQLPLSIAPLQDRIDQMLTRPHPERAGKTWSSEQVADVLGISRKHVERIRHGAKDQARELRLGDAEKWASRFQLHPCDIWGDVYLEHVHQRLAA